MSETLPAFQAMTVNAPVAEVTVLEDRAQVYRIARAELPAGRSTLRIDGVAPVLADRTLWAKVLAGPSGTKVDALRARRRRLHAPDEKPEALKALEQEQTRLAHDHERLKRLYDLGVNHGTRLEGLAMKFLEDCALDAAWGRVEAEAWRAQWQSIVERERQAQDERHRAQFEMEDLNRLEADLLNRIAAVQSPSFGATVWIEADVALPEAGEVEIRFAYIVPGACWRPWHAARLQQGGSSPTVCWQTYACVWQNTGEDWNDAALSFSTQRPSLGSEPPALSTDLLAVMPKQRQDVVEMREQEIRTAGKGRAEQPAGMPGIDDGGEALVLKAPAKATVHSDGRASRIPLFSFETRALAALVAMPEVSSAVHLKTTLDNTANHPVLAGPVDLLRAGGYAGRATTLFVAPGERFDLGWGPDPALRLHREHRELEAETNLLGTWRTKEHRVTVRLSNLGPAHKTVVVRERVPISEVEQVQIETDAKHTTDGKTPDADGFLEWRVDLHGRVQHALDLRYTVRSRTSVVGA